MAETIKILTELLEKDKYGTIIIIFGIFFLGFYMRILAKQVGKLIEKVATIDQYIVTEKAIEQELDKFEKSRDELLKDLEMRIRALEIRKIK
jgi:hypothetical protein